MSVDLCRALHLGLGTPFPHLYPPIHDAHAVCVRMCAVSFTLASCIVECSIVSDKRNTHLSVEYASLMIDQARLLSHCFFTDSYVCLQPVGEMPDPVWTYPLHYIAFHSYTFFGFMRNEFEGTDVSNLEQKSACLS